MKRFILVVNANVYGRLEKLQEWKAKYKQRYCPYYSNKI